MAIGYLNEHHQASFSDVVAASSDKRQEVYSWLFKTRHRNARDSRVRTMLEVEAFTDIHQSWQRLGYRLITLCLLLLLHWVARVIGLPPCLN